MERVNTGTAGACPRENTGWRGLTQALQALVLERHTGGRGLTQALQALDVLERHTGGRGLTQRDWRGLTGACPRETHRVERVNTGTAGACPRETHRGERVNTDTAGACPRETHRVERVNTGTAGACPRENTGWRGLTQTLQALVLERTQGGEG